MAYNRRIGLSVNLPTGATHDILLVQTPEGYPSGQLFFKMEDAPRKITGIQKVAQTFLKVLFTTKGSDVLNPFLGTEFPELTIGANRRVEDKKFSLEVHATIKDAEDQTRRITNGFNLDPGSQLDRVEVIGYDSTGDAISLYIRMITKAGELASVSIPFPELDLKLTNG